MISVTEGSLRVTERKLAAWRKDSSAASWSDGFPAITPGWATRGGGVGVSRESREALDEWPVGPLRLNRCDNAMSL
jgi:hypothetical protein